MPYNRAAHFGRVRIRQECATLRKGRKCASTRGRGITWDPSAKGGGGVANIFRRARLSGDGPTRSRRSISCRHRSTRAKCATYAPHHQYLVYLRRCAWERIRNATPATPCARALALAPRWLARATAHRGGNGIYPPITQMGDTRTGDSVLPEWVTAWRRRRYVWRPCVLRCRACLRSVRRSRRSPGVRRSDDCAVRAVCARSALLARPPCVRLSRCLRVFCVARFARDFCTLAENIFATCVFAWREKVRRDRVK